MKKSEKFWIAEIRKRGLGWLIKNHWEVYRELMQTKKFKRLFEELVK